jgi:hypothetical protein
MIMKSIEFLTTHIDIRHSQLYMHYKQQQL